MDLSNFRATLHALVQICLIACIATLTIAIFAITRSITETLDAVPVQVEQAEAAVVAEMEATRADADQQLDAARNGLLALADKQLTGVRGDTTAELDGLTAVVNSRLGDSLSRVDRALDEIRGLRTQLTPILSSAQDITAHVDEASSILLKRNALPAEILGVTGAAKIALGQTAKTMRAIDEATPQVMENIKATTSASTEASKDTAKLMANLAEATKPLPKWLRVVLGIAPPVAGVMAGAATAYVALH